MVPDKLINDFGLFGPLFWLLAFICSLIKMFYVVSRISHGCDLDDIFKFVHRGESGGILRT